MESDTSAGGGPGASSRFFEKFGMSLGLFLISILLLLAYWVRSILLDLEITSPIAEEFSRLFDLNGECNVPAWYSSLLWQISALCCFLISNVDHGRTGRIPNRIFWIALAATALFFSLDEIASIHEGVGAIADTTGMKLPIYNWIPFGIAFAAVVVLFFIRFIWRLPRDVSCLIILSGIVFVTGSIGFESLGALVELGVLEDFPSFLSWRRSIALEEFLEMAGVILFIMAVRLHHVRLVEAEPAVASAAAEQRRP